MRKESHCLSHTVFTFPWLALPGVAIIKQFLLPPQLFHSSLWFSPKWFPTKFVFSWVSAPDACLHISVPWMPASLQPGGGLCAERGCLATRRKVEMREWVHALQIYNHSSCDPCVTSSPWHLLRTQQLPGKEVQPCPPPPEDDLFKLSACSLAPRMVVSEAVGIFGWTWGECSGLQHMLC